MSNLVYNPPSIWFPTIDYNQEFFNETNSSIITIGYLNANYLTRTGVSNSISTITNFSGQVAISSGLTCLSGLSLTGGLVADTGSFSSTLSSASATFGNASITSVLTTNSLYNTSTTPTLFSNAIGTPIPINPSGLTGCYLGWNSSGGSGETNFANLAQGGIGGFSFSSISAFDANRGLVDIKFKTQNGLQILSECGQLRIEAFDGSTYFTVLNQTSDTCYLASNGISSSLGLVVCDAANAFVTPINMTSNFVNINVPFTPQSLSAFDISHPTSTLPLPTLSNQYSTVGYVTTAISAITSLIGQNNVWTGTNAFNSFHPTSSLPLPTTFNQYATVGYVSSVLPVSLLSLNNTWTGTNTYTKAIQMSIFTDTSTSLFGTGSGFNINSAMPVGSNNTLLGANAGSLALQPLNETVVGGNSGQTVLGNYFANTVLGQNSHYNGNYNTVLGAGSGNFSTTTVYNNSTSIGYGSLTTASNQITLGRNSEIVLVPGSLNVTNNTNCTGPLAVGPSLNLVINTSGNANNIIIGDTASFGTVSASGPNISIGRQNALIALGGNSQIVVGSGNLGAMTSGTSNICIGSNSGTVFTTANQNIIIGNNAYTTGNFSVCTLLGTGAQCTGNNQIVLGTAAETTWIKGKLVVSGQTTSLINNYTTGAVLFTVLPRFLTYTPDATMGFTFPIPSNANIGQVMVWRKIAAGGGQTIQFTCTGSPAVWQILNAVNLITSIAVTTPMQLTWLSTGTIYTQIA
jgi:hypothetical protein